MTPPLTPLLQRNGSSACAPLLLGALIALALLAAPALALETPSLSYDTTDLTTGTSRSVTVTVTSNTGSSVTLTSLSLVGTSPSGCLTTSDPSSGSYTQASASTSGTSYSFSVTSGTSGSCTFQAQAVESSSTTSSADSTLTFISPSSLTVDLVTDPAGSKTSGASYFYVLNVTNPLASAVATDYTLTLPSGTTKSSGDAATGTLSLAAGELTQLNFTLASTSAGTISFALGDTTADSAAITIASSDSSSSSSSGGGGGGGAAATKATNKPALVPGAGLRSNSKLAAALAKVLGQASLSSEARENLIRLSDSVSASTAITKSISAGATSTLTTTVKYTGSKTGRFIVHDRIPKSFAASAANITVSAPGGTVEVVESDPEYAIAYDSMSPGDERNITYSTNRNTGTSPVSQGNATVYAESLAPAAEPAPPAPPEAPPEQPPEAPPEQPSAAPSPVPPLAGWALAALGIILVIAAVLKLTVLKK